MWKAFSLLAATQAGLEIKRKVRVLAIYSIAGIFAFFAVIFGLFCLYLNLAETMGEVDASFIITSALALIAVILAVSAYIFSKRTVKAFPIASTAMVAAPMAAKIISKYPKAGLFSIIGLAALGVALGRKSFEKDHK